MWNTLYQHFGKQAVQTQQTLPDALEQIADRLPRKPKCCLPASAGSNHSPKAIHPLLTCDLLRRRRSGPGDSGTSALWRIAHDLDELAQARRVADLSFCTNDAEPHLRRRRHLAEPPIELSLRGMSIHQSRQAWAEYESRLQSAGLPAPANPYRHLDRSESERLNGVPRSVAPRTPSSKIVDCTERDHVVIHFPCAAGLAQAAHVVVVHA